jgi:hypothetical protein
MWNSYLFVCLWASISANTVGQISFKSDMEGFQWKCLAIPIFNHTDIVCPILCFILFVYIRITLVISGPDIKVFGYNGQSLAGRETVC